MEHFGLPDVRRALQKLGKLIEPCDHRLGILELAHFSHLASPHPSGQFTEPLFWTCCVTTRPTCSVNRWNSVGLAYGDERATDSTAKMEITGAQGDAGRAKGVRN